MSPVDPADAGQDGQLAAGGVDEASQEWRVEGGMWHEVEVTLTDAAWVDPPQGRPTRLLCRYVRSG